jgi:hypothetical protein
MPQATSISKKSISADNYSRSEKAIKTTIEKKNKAKKNAAMQVKKITLSLNEVKQIEEGTKKANSFSKFLKEL